MGAAAGGRWGGTAPPGGGRQGGAAPPGGGRQGGDSPTRTGGDMRGTGRGCGGAGDPATVRECTCQIVHVRTEVRQRIQGAGTPPLVACTHPYTAYRLTPSLPSLREVVAMLVRASRSVEILSEISSADGE